MTHIKHIHLDEAQQQAASSTQDRLFFAFLPNYRRKLTSLLTQIEALLHLHMDLLEILDMPRLHHPSLQASFHCVDNLLQMPDHSHQAQSIRKKFKPVLQAHFATYARLLNTQFDFLAEHCAGQQAKPKRWQSDQHYRAWMQQCTAILRMLC